jgi:RecJ-like exonuclease
MAAMPAGVVAIGGLNASSNGMVVTIDATIDRVTRTAGSMLLRVSDASGQTSVFIPSSVLDAAGAQKVGALKSGARVRMEGEVRLYNNKPEIHVQSASGLK